MIYKTKVSGDPSPGTFFVTSDMDKLFFKTMRTKTLLSGMLLAVTVAFFAGISPVSAATIIPSYTNIIGNETWSAANGPYVFSSLSVLAGASLTIEPGTIIKPMGSSAVLGVQGTLTVGAAGADKVIFTSYADDSIGGNTDGVANTPKEYGDWGGIQASGNGTVAITDTVFKYGGFNTLSAVSSIGSATVSVARSEFISGNNAVSVGGGTVEVYDTVFRSMSQYGIRQTDGTLRFGRDTFENIRKRALSLENGTVQTDGGNSGTSTSSIIFFNNTLAADTVLTKDGLPYVLSNVTVPAGRSLTIQPGAIVKMWGSSTPVTSSGTLTIGSSDPGAEKVVITSYADDTVGGNTDGSDGTPPTLGDWGSIVLTGGTATVANTVFKYGGYSSYAVLHNYGAQISVVGSEFAFGNNGITMAGGTVEVYGSSFHDMGQYAVWNLVPDVQLNAENNWWSSISGPWHETMNPSGQGVHVAGNIDFDPWRTCYGDACPSSVMFLPGIMGSRLYDDQNSSCVAEKIDPKRAWEPSCNDDVRKLYLDSDGKSLDPDIHIKDGDILDEVSIGGANIYKSFIEGMNKMVYTDHLIKDWKPVAYDWRLSLDDILADGSIENSLRNLAQKSNTGKVTIVAHSNGGLLAKALMKKIGDDDTENLVDKVVFVAVPQVGTPLAIAAVLHGYKQGHFPVLDAETARGLAENMPVAYNLLPSEAYFSGAGSSVRTPVVTFESDDQTLVFRGQYGSKIDNYDELERFLVGAEARQDPTADNVKYPISLVSGLLSAARSTHEGIDNNWSPPSSVELYEIAGWGEETLAGLNYKQGSFWHCFGVDPCIDFDPVIIEDGDGTVVVPSALAMSESFPNVKRFWLNLNKYNGNHLDETHSTIFEVSELRDFIGDIISNISNDSFAYITTSAPDPIDVKKRLRYYLHSPLTLELYDEQGNHFGYTRDGSFDKQIPTARYQEFGDVKFVSVPADIPVKLVMNGQNNGGFDLKIEEVRGNEVLATTVFANISSLSSTKVSMDFSDGTIENASDLKIDNDGDGVVDITLEPKIGEVVTTEPSDAVAPTTTVSLSGVQGQNNWYTIDVIVTLTATDNENGSGVDKTEYSLDGTNWTAYVDPFTISTEGTTTLQYRSIDKAGNQEGEKTEVVKIDKTKPIITGTASPVAMNGWNITDVTVSFTCQDDQSGIGTDTVTGATLATEGKDQSVTNAGECIDQAGNQADTVTVSDINIDKTAPEAKISFNKDTRKLDVIGTDTLSTVASSETVQTAGTKVMRAVMFTDQAGHTTKLVLSHPNLFLGQSIIETVESIAYDGTITTLPDTRLLYAWVYNERMKKYSAFASTLNVEDVFADTLFMPYLNMTILLERTPSGSLSLKYRSGMVVSYMETERGNMRIKY